MSYKIQNIFIKKASFFVTLFAVAMMFVSSSVSAAVSVSFSTTVQPNSIIVTGLTRTCDGGGELNVELVLTKVPSYDPVQTVPVSTSCNVPVSSNITFNNLSPGTYFIFTTVYLTPGSPSPQWNNVAHGPWDVTGTGGGTQQDGNNGDDGNTNQTDGNTNQTDGNTNQTGGNTNQTGGNTNQTCPDGTTWNGTTCVPNTNTTPPTLNNPINVGSIQEFIAKLLDIALTIAIPIVALAIIYSGFLFVMARGNSEKLETAKQTLLYVIIGAALLLGAWVIANAIAGTIAQIRA